MQGLESKARTEFFKKPINERYRVGDAYQAATRVVFAVKRVDGTSYGITEREPDGSRKAFEPSTAVLRDFGGHADIWRHASMDAAEDIALNYLLDGGPQPDNLDLKDPDFIEKLEAMTERPPASESVEAANEEARAAAIDCIEAHKDAIERLAQTLLQRGSLTGEEVHELIEQ